MEFSEDKNTLTCRFDGDLNSTICSDIEQPLRERIGAFLADQDHPRLVFDLSGVRYISSAFLRLCLCHCKAVGVGNFQVTNPSPEVAHVFAIAGFTEMMRIS